MKIQIKIGKLRKVTPADPHQITRVVSILFFFIFSFVIFLCTTTICRCC